MKKLMSVCLILALALTACAPASDAGTPASSPGAAQSDPNRDYALEKLNEVNDMVLDRQVVPGDYLRYLDEDMAEKVEEYNWALSTAKTGTVRYAKTWADSFIQGASMSPEDDEYDAAWASYGRYMEEGDNYFRFIDEFSTALLWYPDHYAFMGFQPVVGYPAGLEGGGSGGLWASGYYLDEHERKDIAELNAIADELLDRFDDARAGWGQEP